MNVTKRDGRVVLFDKEKIKTAVIKAFLDVDGEETSYAKDKARDIANSIMSVDKDLSVEEIQDLVEFHLMTSKRKDVARSYIIYRNDRSRVREKNSDIVKKVMKRVKASDVENSNANVDERSFSGREKEASSDLGKSIALEYGGLSEEVAKAHKDMLVYQHDLEKAIYGIHNCLNLDFEEIFKYGFKTRNGDVRPPATFSTGCQLIAVAFQCQSQVQFGGVGSIHYDYDLKPLVKKSFVKHYIMAIVKSTDDFVNLNLDNMTEKELDDWVNENKKKYLTQQGLKEEDIYIDNKDALNKHFYQSALFDLYNEGKQACEALYHNLNTLESRQGSQVPFTSINLGRDTSTEGRLVTKWTMNASINGIGKHHLTSIFPISIFQYKVGTNANPEDKNYDLKQLALKSMSKRIYPNWVNCDWSQFHEDEDNPDTFGSTMGKCKLQLI